MPVPQSTETETLIERVAQLTAHRACHSAEHDPANGKIHGYCMVCGVPWPCQYAGEPMGGVMALTILTIARSSIADQLAWLRFKHQYGPTKHINPDAESHGPQSDHPHGWFAICFPDWDVRQKIESLSLDLAAVDSAMRQAVPLSPSLTETGSSDASADEMIRGLADNAHEISKNSTAVQREWTSATPNRSERERILMELRHDLSDALKCVQILQERLDADQ